MSTHQSDLCGVEDEEEDEDDDEDELVLVEGVEGLLVEVEEVVLVVVDFGGELNKVDFGVCFGVETVGEVTEGEIVVFGEAIGVEEDLVVVVFV